MKPINLDYAASTPMLPEVREAMAVVLADVGNPSSIHQEGREARERVERARRQVAALIGANPEAVYFTSCGTEANNWAIKGLFAANKRKGPHVIVSAIEHPSVTLAAKRLQMDGAEVTILPVDREGCVLPGDLKSALKPGTVLVSIMLANGEVGTIEPIKELTAIAHEHSALFHADAIAAVGHWPVDVRELGVDALSLSANQFYGPQGAAALYVREGVRILPLLEGGGQEQGGRSGTENVAAIVGMGAAADVARQRLPERVEQTLLLRDRLRDGLVERIPNLRLNGSRSNRLPHNLHVCVEGAASESLVLGLDHEGIAAGLGSACNAKAMRPSHVLKAMGLTESQAQGALVFTMGEMTTEEEIGRALDVIPHVVEKLRRVTRMTVRAT
ncbi:MAG TPA: cysteine desulfurase NifS [Candidatus Omnitrophica bacterium]|nr:MAG: hypothetical protein A2Z92_03010 [Omnitrophica WOR_2 bacterium GWA2_63_20]OGX17170.1 MAG: hypothetical protein A2105_01145 [Omnitrophica WOR_2 bacterium GWF2_63_9]OGX34668.1 MAG: hypothetical protein A3B73_05970 [Omnitrophica WOR_2 bacterium RIFCSPHIGHO2_02_FULL_63_39]OGX44635.1 MAG: hypothetical protein A3I71_07035 [Omnitrophica WOR_2 bacterium RIFCSPLOWO2_02_FULL_63_16]OGX49205.1 MAG: hypothetical protein A3G88_04260 [Omnitrophica WOR_2 bacterium RIFCSPLOWO2_12_FULL_63_16]HAM39778.1 